MSRYVVILGHNTCSVQETEKTICIINIIFKHDLTIYLFHSVERSTQRGGYGHGHGPFLFPCSSLNKLVNSSFVLTMVETYKGNINKINKNLL